MRARVARKALGNIGAGRCNYRVSTEGEANRIIDHKHRTFNAGWILGSEVEPCMCIWERGCGGTGFVRCRGCGGDLCICTCGGEMECMGCEDCRSDEDAPMDDDEAEWYERGTDDTGCDV